MKQPMTCAIAAITLIISLSACGTNNDEVTKKDTTAPQTETTTPSQEPTKESALTAMEHLTAATEAANVVTQIQITEDNDPNNLFGRPNGYIDAAIAHIDGYDCTEIASKCGVTIEVFKTEDEAKMRGKFIQTALAEMQVLGTEYDYTNGTALLRITGEMKPSEAEAISSAFGGTPIEP